MKKREPMQMYTKEQIEEFVTSEELRYQSVALPHGIRTPGDPREEALEVAFGNGVKDKSVLDIGSFLGLFCLEAMQRGARSAVGLELNRDRLRQAQKLADIKGLQPQYIRTDIEDFPEIGKHDIVLCLNMLHHLRDPIRVLRYLALHTSDTLLLEVAQFGKRDIKKLNKLWNNDPSIMRSLLLRLTPMARILRMIPSVLIAPYSPKAKLRTFFFSEKALLTVLQSHMKLFASVTIQPSSFKDRYFAICKKLAIKRLIIVSGACSSGKSTFIENLKSGNHPQIASEDALRGQVSVTGNALRNKPLDHLFSQQHNSTVIFHYDITAVDKFGIHSYKRDPSLDIIACAESIQVVIIAPDAATLRQQIMDSEGGTDGALKSKHHQECLKNYHSDSWLRTVYGDWLNFISTAAPQAVLYAYEQVDNQARSVSEYSTMQDLSARINAIYPLDNRP